MQLKSEFLTYLIETGFSPGQRLPSIQDVSRILGISISKLREQLEVARVLGLVEVHPKTGISTLDYSFLPGIQTSLRFAMSLDPAYFNLFGELRDHIEAGFWHKAVRLLQPGDKQYLRSLVDRAWEKLHGSPIQIPHLEHRELHLTIFSRLNNLFVLDLLEAYWDAYEIVGLDLYSDYEYLERVWNYHQKMVEAIVNEEYDIGYQVLVEHIGMLHHRPELNRFRSEMMNDVSDKRGNKYARSDD